MKKFPLAIAVATFVCFGSIAMADDDQMHGKNKDEKMKEMDTNSDGKISRDEYMRFHEKKWQRMDKSGSGTVDLKDMQRMHDQHMQKGSRSKTDSSTTTKDKPSTY